MKIVTFSLFGFASLVTLSSSVSAQTPISTNSELNQLYVNQAQCAAISSSKVCYEEYAKKITALKATLVKPPVVKPPVALPLAKPPTVRPPVVKPPVIRPTVPASSNSELNRLLLRQAQCPATFNVTACYQEYAQKIAALKAHLVKPPVVKPPVVIIPPTVFKPNLPNSSSAYLNRLLLNQKQCSAFANAKICYEEYAKKIAAFRSTQP